MWKTLDPQSWNTPGPQRSDPQSGEQQRSEVRRGISLTRCVQSSAQTQKQQAANLNRKQPREYNTHEPFSENTSQMTKSSLWGVKSK